VRTRVLEGEGIVGEVLFPNGGVPFGGFGESAEHELRGVGNRAYDRWLLDFANELPGRRAALAMLTVHDLDATVAEIRWAAKSGMKGVIIPTVPGSGLPPYLDRRYDPLWAACEECAMPVHIHAGGGTPRTWPKTRRWLSRCFAGVPAADVRAILTDNPARLYGFDVAKLQPIADRVGPTLEEITGAQERG
jgi:predicted TIM-barrel fold metal-dependent hydrolase